MATNLHRRCVHILGDFIFGPDEKAAGIFIFESGGLLSGIEVYGLAGDVPAVLPRADALRLFSILPETR